MLFSLLFLFFFLLRSPPPNLEEDLCVRHKSAKPAGDLLNSFRIDIDLGHFATIQQSREKNTLWI